MAKCHIRPIPLCKGPRDKSKWLHIVSARLVSNHIEVVESCNYVWFIEGAERTVLVDAGATAQMFHARGITEEDIQSLDKGLGKLDLKPEDIEIVILTQLHWDHVALSSRFRNARFFVQKAEVDFARNPHPTQERFYDKELIEELDFEIIDGDKQIIDGIRVLLTPGHTPGGQSVAIETPKGTAIITGFCCTQENFEPPKDAGALEFVPPGIHTDVLQVYDSAIMVKKMADMILPIHDTEFITVDKVP
jgi:glyoxylase-like metal-dependent hydrolase (beta-lactamase superfamily II)